MTAAVILISSLSFLAQVSVGNFLESVDLDLNVDSTGTPESSFEQRWVECRVISPLSTSSLTSVNFSITYCIPLDNRQSKHILLTTFSKSIADDAAEYSVNPFRLTAYVFRVIGQREDGNVSCQFQAITARGSHVVGSVTQRVNFKPHQSSTLRNAYFKVCLFGLLTSGLTTVFTFADLITYRNKLPRHLVYWTYSLAFLSSCSILYRTLATWNKFDGFSAYGLQFSLKHNRMFAFVVTGQAANSMIVILATTIHIINWWNLHEKR